jgi:hypothetical protein
MAGYVTRINLSLQRLCHRQGAGTLDAKGSKLSTDFRSALVTTSTTSVSDATSLFDGFRCSTPMSKLNALRRVLDKHDKHDERDAAT